MEQLYARIFWQLVWNDAVDPTKAALRALNMFFGIGINGGRHCRRRGHSCRPIFFRRPNKTLTRHSKKCFAQGLLGSYEVRLPENRNHPEDQKPTPLRDATGPRPASRRRVRQSAVILNSAN